ncbi:hypothetical protein DL93DRAFT_2149541 [Clavulina sp. PMI_390]|nr:hypothetical protein DL93DRAFT_2149541 [Clavulina sp. PMI_390]
MAETEVTIGPEVQSATINVPKVKPAPQKAKMPLRFVYHPSPDGVDENLLVMLHGLGDTEAPFANLGRQLNLPQTAVLSLRAPSKIPYLDDEDAFQWYESFDRFGDLLTQPNPTSALDVMDRVLNYLTSECSWPPDRIHLFGFAQGGSVALEITVRRWKASLPAPSATADPSANAPLPIASVVSADGPLISYPTFKPLCATPILFFHRGAQANGPVVSSLKKGFSYVNEVAAPMPPSQAQVGGMPRGKDEWAKVIEFWSRMLSSRTPEMDGLHPVLSGGPSLPTK